LGTAKSQANKVLVTDFSLNPTTEQYNKEEGTGGKEEGWDLGGRLY